MYMIHVLDMLVVALFPEPGKYHVMMVDATLSQEKGVVSIQYLTSSPLSSLVFFVCTCRGEPGNEAVHMPMCIGTCTCSILVVMGEREREIVLY